MADGALVIVDDSDSPAPDLSGDDTEWVDRSAYWQQQAQWKPRHPHQKRRHRNPLVLGGHGVRLRIDAAPFLYKTASAITRRSEKNGASFQAIPICRPASWSSVSTVASPLMSSPGSLPRASRSVRSTGRQSAGGCWRVGYAADPQLVEAQCAAHASKSRTMEISQWLVAEKIARSAETLTKCIGSSPARERALCKLAGSVQEMQHRPPPTIDALRGVEGRVAQAYFTAWRSMPLSWKGLGHKPIPQEWHQIGPRVTKQQTGCR